MSSSFEIISSNATLVGGLIFDLFIVYTSCSLQKFEKLIRKKKIKNFTPNFKDVNEQKNTITRFPFNNFLSNLQTISIFVNNIEKIFN